MKPIAVEWVNSVFWYNPTLSLGLLPGIRRALSIKQRLESDENSHAERHAIVCPEKIFTEKVYRNKEIFK